MVEAAYDATKTTTSFRTRHGEDDSVRKLVSYDDGNDLAQGQQSSQILVGNVGADNDQC
jgi:hypothetical protein